MDPEMQLENRTRLARLFDLYSGLLTEKQRKAFELHDLSDWSLQEVADKIGGTRQGVYDLVQRARLRLLELEGILGFGSRLESQARNIGLILSRYSGNLPRPFLEEMEGVLGENAEEEEQDG